MFGIQQFTLLVKLPTNKHLFVVKISSTPFDSVVYFDALDSCFKYCLSNGR